MQEHGFLHQALVYLAAGVVVVPLSKRTGLGSVLGYLIAGMAIGPWGLKLVSEPEAILQIAELSKLEDFSLVHNEQLETE